jgi:hypothetical protein
VKSEAWVIGQMQQKKSHKHKKASQANFKANWSEKLKKARLSYDLIKILNQDNCIQI